MLSGAVTIDGESFIRLACFLIVLFSVSTMEIMRPRRKLLYSKTRRWITNLGFGLTNVLLIDLSLPILGVAAAITAVEAGYQTGVSGYQAEIEAFGSCFDTEDFKEGTTAFLEKRKPNF